MKYTSISKLLEARRIFANNPAATIKTGIWNNSTWDREQFYTWFRKCLLHKTGGSDYTERQFNKILDGRIINDYYLNRSRRPGLNILRDPKMKRQYPHIDNFTNYA